MMQPLRSIVVDACGWSFPLNFSLIVRVFVEIYAMLDESTTSETCSGVRIYVCLLLLGGEFMESAKIYISPR